MSMDVLWVVPVIVPLHITYQCHAIYTDIFRIHESQHCNFHDLNTHSLSAFKALAITPPLRSRVFATPVLAYKETMHRHPVWRLPYVTMSEWPWTTSCWWEGKPLITLPDQIVLSPHWHKGPISACSRLTYGHLIGEKSFVCFCHCCAGVLLVCEPAFSHQLKTQELVLSPRRTRFTDNEFERKNARILLLTYYCTRAITGYYVVL